jgi:hypothetical protein
LAGKYRDRNQADDATLGTEVVTAVLTEDHRVQARRNMQQ